MARTKRKGKHLPTIWRVPDDLWDTIIQPLLMELDPPAKTGRKRIDQRKALDGIIHQARTGCQWEALPREFGPRSSVHGTLQRWIERGVIVAFWGVLVDQCDELRNVQWQWQAADGVLGKARLGGMMLAQTQQIVGKTARNAA